IGLPALTALALLSAAAAWLASGRRPWLWGLSLALAMGLGGDAALRVRQPDSAALNFAPREAAVTLEVDRLYPATSGRKTQTGLARLVDEDLPAGIPAGTRVYFSAMRRGGVPLERSGRYLVRGVLQPLPPPDDGAGFAAYLENMGVRLTLTRAMVRREIRPPGWAARQANATRARLDGLLALGIERHPAELALYRGMLLGEKAELSAGQQELFTHSGTFHIFVIAGLHIGVIATAIHSLLLLLRVPRRAALLLGLALLGLYVAVTGAGLPARRAFVMIAIFTAARVWRLPVNALALLAAAAFGVLLAEPAELFSTGFQMSFAVVTGLVCVGAPLARSWQEAWRPWALLPPADHAWWQRTLAWSGRKILGAVAISGTALVASAIPIIASFGVFAPVSLLANLAVVPLAMLAISAGFLALLSGLLQLASIASLFNHSAVLLSCSWNGLSGWATPCPAPVSPPISATPDPPPPPSPSWWP
ncbi:MAG: ComEC/Rec2 family competence protein, partial [Opitutales bacterium]